MTATATHTSPLDRIRPGAVVVTALGVIFALCVLLQFQPLLGDQALDDGASGRASQYALDSATAQTLPIFIVGAALVVLFVATVLISCARRPGSS